jgi:hypothetical protein
MGFEQRIRNEDWNNIMDYDSSANDEREQIRWRTRLWLTTPAVSGISLNVGIDQETNQKLGQNRYFDEIFSESLSVNIEPAFAKGLSPTRPVPAHGGWARFGAPGKRLAGGGRICRATRPSDRRQAD